MQLPEVDDFIERVQQWNQGDYVLGEFPILWGFDKNHPLTKVSLELAEESDPVLGVSIGAEKVSGFVVVSQTCDIVRRVSERPYVQLAPIVSVDEHDVELIRLRLRPRFVYLPSLAEHCLVADLDRILTVEKSFLAVWERFPAFGDEPQRRSFAETIRRYYDRPAFPNAFVEGLRKLETWFREKHDRTPDLPKKGPTPFHPRACLRALEMVLVRPNPSWDAPNLHVDFILIRKSEEDGITALVWEEFRKTCEGKVSLPKEITSRWSTEIPLSNLPAKLYLECDQLDLAYLSDETRRKNQAAK